jgi:hypothetical protein
MAEFIRLLLMPALVALGAWGNLRFQAGSIRTAKVAVLTLLGLWVTLLLTGLTVRSAAPHRALAHLFFGVAWVAIFFAIGVELAEGVRSRRWSRAFHVLVLLFALGAMQAAASTGYLGRLSDQPADVLRFRLIHQLLTPGALGVSLVGWLRLNRTSGGSVA